MNSVYEMTKKETLNLLILEIQKIKTFNDNNIFADCVYKMDLTKSGNKKFIAQPSLVPKEVRKYFKCLLKKYLGFKLAERPCAYDGSDKQEDTYDNSIPEQNLFKFKIKLENKEYWIELFKEIFGRYSLIGIQKNNTREYRALTMKENLIFQRGLLTRILNGNQLEVINEFLPEKKPDSFWSGWKSTMVNYHSCIEYLPYRIQNVIYSIGELFLNDTFPWSEYEKIIHPIIKQVALQILKETHNESPKVLEICGGDGRLAIELAGNHAAELAYYLFDVNERSTQNAKRRISAQHLDSKVVVIKADVTNENDFYYDSLKSQPMEEESIDLIIGSGALTACVLENKPSALKVANKCYKLLKTGGKMVLAGHAHSLLHREDFMNIGFHVINSYLVGIRDESFSTHVNSYKTSFEVNKDFYIVEK